MFKALLVLAIGTALAPMAASAQSALSSYRNVTLGESVPAVVERLQVTAADVKVLHERPSLVQELTWRPHRFVSGSTVTPDALAEMVLTFHMGRLARIVALYDRERTQGLTNADLHDSLSRVYGLATLRSTPTQTAIEEIPTRQLVGRWEDAETVLILWREDFPNRVGLTITSIAADERLQTAIVDGGRVQADEAPQRERDRQDSMAAAIRERNEKLRLANKAAFKP